MLADGRVTLFAQFASQEEKDDIKHDHVSVSAMYHPSAYNKPTDDDMQLVIERFGLQDFHEDNQHSAVNFVRHLWKALK